MNAQLPDPSDKMLKVTAVMARLIFLTELQRSGNCVIEKKNNDIVKMLVVASWAPYATSDGFASKALQARACRLCIYSRLNNVKVRGDEA